MKKKAAIGTLAKILGGIAAGGGLGYGYGRHHGAKKLEAYKTKTKKYTDVGMRLNELLALLMTNISDKQKRSTKRPKI